MRKIITLDQTPNIGIFDPAEGGVFLRTDQVRFPKLKQLWEQSLALFWTVKMVDFTKDSAGYKTLPPVAQRMFNLTNGYQSLMDSGVVGIYNHLALLTNNVEVALSYQQIAFAETIHATSYSEGLVQMLGHEAEAVINIVYTDPVVRTRLASEIKITDNLIENPTVQNIYHTIVATYLLEAIKFPFSFFVTFSINKGYNNAINGFNQLISRISQEELDIHVPTNKLVIKQMIKDYNLDINLIKKTADTLLEQELKWNKYLQQDGPIPGYNEAIGEEMIRYFHNKALRDVGYKDIETIKPTTFVTWFNHYRDPDTKQVSQQEMKSTQYQKGVMRNDLHLLDTPKEDNGE